MLGIIGTLHFKKMLLTSTDFSPPKIPLWLVIPGAPLTIIGGSLEIRQILGLREPSRVLSPAGVPAAGVIFSFLLFSRSILGVMPFGFSAVQFGWLVFFVFDSLLSAGEGVSGDFSGD